MERSIHSFQKLMDKLTASECHFVRCIKPNDKKQPGIFESAKVLDQLKFSGAMETVQIRKAGYLFRMKFLEFARRYFVLAPKDRRTALLKSKASNSQLEAAAKELLKTITPAGTGTLKR